MVGKITPRDGPSRGPPLPISDRDRDLGPPEVTCQSGDRRNSAIFLDLSAQIARRSKMPPERPPRPPSKWPRPPKRPENRRPRLLMRVIRQEQLLMLSQQISKIPLPRQQPSRIYWPAWQPLPVPLCLASNSLNYWPHLPHWPRWRTTPAPRRPRCRWRPRGCPGCSRPRLETWRIRPRLCRTLLSCSLCSCPILQQPHK